MFPSQRVYNGYKTPINSDVALQMSVQILIVDLCVRIGVFSLVDDVFRAGSRCVWMGTGIPMQKAYSNLLKQVAGDWTGCFWCLWSYW